MVAVVPLGIAVGLGPGVKGVLVGNGLAAGFLVAVGDGPGLGV